MEIAVLGSEKIMYEIKQERGVTRMQSGGYNSRRRHPSCAGAVPIRSAREVPSVSHSGPKGPKTENPSSGKTERWPNEQIGQNEAHRNPMDSSCGYVVNARGR